MHLEEGTRDHFMRWLGDEYPHLVDGYHRLYAGRYPPKGYRDEVQTVVGMMKQKYGVVGSRQ
jgi:hypothetical protein